MKLVLWTETESQMVEIDVNESVDQIFTDFDEKKRSRKTTSSSQGR